MSKDGKTVRDDRGAAPERATIREGPLTVREGSPTVREDRATVRESNATIREGNATVREEVPPRSRDEQVAGWLPPTLAADYRMVEPLPALGGEADLYVLERRRPAPDAGAAARLVAKVYRHGITPKEDVIRRVHEADLAHVIRLEARGQDAGRSWELMEYAEHGSLRQLIEQEGPRLPDRLVRDILRQLNEALAGLHALSLEHRDLKPGNVLVRSRTPLELVLTDFGISSLMDESMRHTSAARTARYAPPEAISGVIEHTTFDYWSLGMMLVEMLLGKHPYDGCSEGIIIRQLTTQPVDELAEGLDGPWSKLCRGLLRREPSDRWDAAAVSKWLADPNDPSLVVAREARPAAAAPASGAAIDFDGAAYTVPAELGAALSRDWAKAESFWKRRLPEIRTWLTDGLGLPELGDALAEIDDSEQSLDAQVFNFIYVLAPNAPLRFRGEDLSAEGLAALAERAANPADAGARTTFLALYRDRILMVAGSLPEREAAAEVWRRWEETVADHERIRSEMRTRDVTVPEPDDDVLVSLLAAGVPGAAVLAALRTEAHRASTPEARQCPWFRDLGTPEEMPIAVLPMLRHIQAPAERGAKLARMAPVRACVGGMFVGFLFGSQAEWAYRGVGYGSEFAHNFEGSLMLALVIFSFAMSVMWYRRGTAGVTRWVREVYALWQQARRSRRQRSRREIAPWSAARSAANEERGWIPPRYRDYSRYRDSPPGSGGGRRR